MATKGVNPLITRSRAITRSPDHPIPLLSQLLKEPNNALNPAIEVGDMGLFIGSMQIVVRQAEGLG